MAANQLVQTRIDGSIKAEAAAVVAPVPARARRLGRRKCNIRSVAVRFRLGKGGIRSALNPSLFMTTKSSVPAAAAKKKLLSRIAAAQRQADVARKTAKLAKLGFRHAKDKFKAAKRAAKKLRKAVKTLKTELAALGAKKAPAKRVAKKVAAKRPRSAPVAAPAPEPVAVEPVSVAPETPPAAQA